VIISGPASHVQTITEATTEPVSVEGATGTVQDEVTVGVTDAELRVSGTQTATVTVAITPAPIEQAFDGVPVHMRNVPPGRRSTVTPSSVTVHVRGTRELLARTDVRALAAFVDLAGLGAGRYNLPVRVESTEPVGISRIEPEAVSVLIR
jgi:hypothetical protein